MLVLGIETSGHAGSVALWEEGVLLVESEIQQTGRRHARTLIPEVQQLFAVAQRQLSDLSCVGVSLGPGSFTGLRVGAVCAKTLAYALKCKIQGVDTFAAIACQSVQAGELVWVIDDALRGDVYAGQYRVFEGASAECLRRPAILNAEILRSWLDESCPLSGPGIEKLAPLFDNSQMTDRRAWRPRAATIARIAATAGSEMVNDDFWGLKPTYLRRSAAEENADAEK